MQLVWNMMVVSFVDDVIGTCMMHGLCSQVLNAASKAFRREYKVCRVAQLDTEVSQADLFPTPPGRPSGAQRVDHCIIEVRRHQMLHRNSKQTYGLCVQQSFVFLCFNDANATSSRRVQFRHSIDTILRNIPYRDEESLNSKKHKRSRKNPDCLGKRY